MASRSMTADPVTIRVDSEQTVSGILLDPEHPFACYVPAHGVGAGMTNPFLSAVAAGLNERGYGNPPISVPTHAKWIEATGPTAVGTGHGSRGGGGSDSPRPTLPLFAGGKSFGARMTSLAQANAPLPSVVGLALIGFPLHPAEKPSDDRAKHLSEVRVSMLFVQGTRDALADQPVFAHVLKQLSGLATSHLIEHADHSFHVPVRWGKTDAQVLDEALDALTTWASGIARRKPTRDSTNRQ